MARYAPGLPTSELARMTPEETSVLRRAVEANLKDERALALEHTKAIVKAAGRARVVF